MILWIALGVVLVGQVVPTLSDVQCPGGEWQCPEGYTCFLMVNHMYGCCPLPNAICCSDLKHCCPNGFKCDSVEGSCYRGNQKAKMVNTVPAVLSKTPLSRPPSVVKCNTTIACPDGDTCCKTTASFMCCPGFQSVCCADQIHCCPRGWECTEGSKTCTKKKSKTSSYRLQRRIRYPFTLKHFLQNIVTILCPDEHSQCPDGNTCCKLLSGQYGCCPLPKAVCCSDHVHCCPGGYTCDTSTGTCNKGSSVIPMIKKMPSKPVREEVGNVICPDGQSQCPDGNTCCKLASGQYGCCPLPKAVCCSDHIHCCPHGYTCDASTSTCNGGSSVILLIKKMPSKPVRKEVGNVICPGGQSECPDRNTCCKLASGKYGCCPLPKAVCCIDGIHCCPNEYTCDTSTSTCNKGSSVILLIKKMPSKPVRKEVVNVICPGGQSECPDGNTCCKLASGQYGCCPLPKAVCCSDHEHCCPHGYTCDTSVGTCKKGSSVILLIKKMPSKPLREEVGNVICPDGQSQCPDGNTCCKLASGQYGCCPFPKAVCCPDHIHCCPNGYTCDTSGTCIRESSVISMIQKMPSKPVRKEVGNVICPDGQSQCPDGNTCCRLPSGQYGCCPLPNAVCCSDHIHCCPRGYTCDASTSTCNMGSSVILLIKKMPSKPVRKEVGNVICPGGQSECPDRNTCCKLASGKYGCCPLPKAVCCIDGIHCCPNEYTCDTSTGTCNKGSLVILLIKKMPSKPVTKEVGSVFCPGGHSECPNGNTCCRLPSGQYGCCPLPNAVCCSDHIHCCPNGYTCDTSGTCIRESSVISMIKKMPSKPVRKEVGNVICPDGQSQCPDGNTCCKLASGQYGCCPLPKAVCCPDHVHCCPNGYTCDTSGTCIRESSVISMIKKMPSKPVRKEVGSVFCPGGHSECPNGNTCCRLPSGQYGCCPLPNAVCCSDHIHCCPRGYTCDASTSTCNMGSSVILLIKKMPSKPVRKEVGNVICPGGQSECPDRNTCCKLASGQYGCCPLPNAVCCSDHIHCCPHGYTCDTSVGTCNMGSSVILLIKKMPSKPVREEVGNVICPDGQSQCPDGNTCCKLASGQYGCCPLPKAVCCSDHIHCCPNGYTCDASTSTCNKGSSVILLIKKMPSKPVRKEVGNVICPDGQSQCPDGNTCCKLASGQYGCCPLPKAVCCPDHVHCCPNGYTCDTSGTCIRESSVISMIKKMPSKPVRKEVGSVFCPGGHSECPNGNTCCRLPSGQYGCCPLPNAVCCSDHEHCCPHGYTCDTSVGTCKKGSSVILLIKKMPSKPLREEVGNVICPDGQSQCPDGNTCCKLASGQYGCCPFPKAVCCPDHIHCCPNGYTCDTSGTCIRESSVISMIQKMPSKPVRKEVGNVICPDGQSQCPDGNTCCRLPSGQYGCCPLPNAVCCSDHIHCCPRGYTCDASTSTCNMGSSVILLIKKMPSKPVRKEVGNVICPGGQSECPDRNTCCKLASGKYGCCPLPKAVCCIDGIHCCPNEYTCDTSTGTCNKGSLVILLIKKMPSKPVTKEVGSVFCPGGHSECPNGNTCCRLPSGQYVCCPLPNAVCCSDHIHCCPNGYTCDTSGTCIRESSVISMIKKMPSKPVRKEVGNVICPDGQSQCPDGNTCCKLASGQYGCCPLPKAVCCPDHVHCCPNGYTCDTSGTCIRESSVISMIKKMPSKPVRKEVGSVFCPGGHSECPNGNTCCRLPSGQYGCCPLPNAVCCSDHIHCCPRGYTCDASTSTCNMGSSVILLIKKMPSKPVRKEVGNVICPGGQSECPDRNTCCKLASGQYGCCPLPNAVCCSDHIHCCPHGYTCDTSVGTCNMGSSVILLIKKMPSKPVREEVGNMICPDGQSQCPDGNTCCKLASGQYGCCPLPKAVCCSDHIHCCPNGYTCDASTSTCNKGSSVILLIKKMPSKPVRKEVGNVICPDGQSQCPDGNTCCKLASGQYGCCPLPKAVCCPDHVHCCPNGYTCDTSGTCIRESSVISMIKKMPSKPVRKEVGSVFCPGGHSECPNGNTCCRLPSGQYGCCPLPNAVCCSDHIHCCPRGYTCDASTSTCNMGSSVILLIKKMPSKHVRKEVGNVICPGGQSECPDRNTCCKLASGQYGCCPLPNAVCCSDHIHCCPHGYTCDTSVGTCNMGSSVILLIKKMPSKPVRKEVGNVICPGGQSQCPDRNTCCKLASGQYGCCPLPKAVCCSDHIHCCPHGYTCDTSVGTCNMGSSVILLIKKMPSKPVREEVGNVICPDGQSQCPDGNTCCKLASGQYGCCPLPKAVCCSDHIHCCPNGYTCDASTSTCNKGSSVILLIKKMPSKPVRKEVGNVICPDGQSQCPDGNTCCKLASGQYGCCPLPKAVCCPDHVHCCPNGYTCDTSGTCIRESSVISMIKKMPSKPVRKEVGSVFCPGGHSECPNGNTCCRLPSGQYGCCPLPNAVCCSDHIHCCPRGYTCDASTSTCNMGSSVILLIKKMPSKPVRKEVGNVICPGGQSECPDRNTCCKLASGQYGCCPLPNAVCCSDHIHCCPHGYTCDTSVGTCNMGSSVILLIKKMPSKPVREEVGNVICPDGQSQCPDGNTCCKLASGQYGCCPLPKAVCCSDHIHCCPNGYTCDASTSTCNKGSSVILLIKKMPSKPVRKEVGNVICPDGQSQCPDGNTCCKLASGQYGCCPLPKAVCCPDHVHCCPNGYTCDTSGTCIRESSVISMIKKMPSKPVRKEVGNVICPDGQSQCPDGNTCCKLASGQYGCCPLPKAVCCPDHVHCCPNGYTCDTSGTCIRGSSVISMIKMMSSKPLKIAFGKRVATPSGAKFITCPDHSQCYDYQTCCLLTSGGYGCCPLPNAVCCSDHEHCCPCGYRCDVSSDTCYMTAETSLMIPFHSTVEASLDLAVDCKDGSHCNNGETCCPVGAGKYGCCPLPSAVCCSDDKYCCPSGYTCDVKTKKCYRGLKVIPMLLKKLAVKPSLGKSIVPKTVIPVDDKIRFVPRDAQVRHCNCKPYHTCCNNHTGEPHCCPLPNATCCSDGLHCCPEGFTCDDKKGCIHS